MDRTADLRTLDWHGAYRGSLKDKIHPDAFAHPAKMAWGLARRIFEHLFERGWLKKGDLVADCFGGIGVTGLLAASFGSPCILVELEEKWLDLAKQSLELHREQWEKMGKPIPICIQGDSRNFSFIIREAIDSIVTSPPFQQALKGGGIMKDGYASPQRPDLPPDWIAEHTYAEGQIGTAEGQIGAMKEGNLDEVVAVITSPSYADSIHDPATRSLEHKAELLEAAGHNAKRWLGQRRCQQIRAGDYGQSEGQLGSMPEGDHGAVISGIVTSPAYAESLQPETEEQTRRKQERIAKAKTIHNGRALEKPSPGKAALGGGYGVSTGQLGAMKEGDHEAVVNGIVTSPPFENVDMHSPKGGVYEDHLQRTGRRTDLVGRDAIFERVRGGFGNKDNLGSLHGDTYWAAVAQVYQECWKVLKPGGVMVVVVKDFVRNKKRVPLCDQTLELLQAIGFNSLERIRAWLVKGEYLTTLFSEKEERDFYEAHERERRAKYEARTAKAKAEGRRISSYRPHTFEGWLTAWRQKKTASFFRRDTEKKGSPRIDWDEVLICQKVSREHDSTLAEGRLT